ncbi:hypothetical protein EJV44_14755 [Ancylobacter aquaticus]|nr:hypothetical protein EJV44_14755 [Ancylobacter aquaticus]
MRALFAALILAAAPLGAMAQTQLPPNAGERPEAAAPAESAKSGETAKSDEAAKSGETAKPAEPDRGKRLDALFAALKAAPDEESAKAIAARIDVALTPSGSDTADLLMARASQATQAKKFDLAVELLDGLLAIEPDYLEAWNKRATVFFLRQDFSNALIDLRQVVAREPRHYGAWAGIAIICKEIGDEKRSLEAARHALALYPHLGEIKDLEEELSIKVEGRPI